MFGLLDVIEGGINGRKKCICFNSHESAHHFRLFIVIFSKVVCPCGSNGYWCDEDTKIISSKVIPANSYALLCRSLITNMLSGMLKLKIDDDYDDITPIDELFDELLSIETKDHAAIFKPKKLFASMLSKVHPRVSLEFDASLNRTNTK